jgi:hypothetical protein
LPQAGGRSKAVAGEFGGARAPTTPADSSDRLTFPLTATTALIAPATAALYGRNWCSLDLRRLRAAEKAERR